MVLLRHLLGDALRRLRLRQGRTLREVSASARVSLGYLSEVERGQKEASSELLSAICTALGIPLSQVMREVSDNFALAELQNEPVFADVMEPSMDVEVAGIGRHSEHDGESGEQRRVPAAAGARMAAGAGQLGAGQVAAHLGTGQLRPGQKMTVPTRLPLATSLPVGDPAFDQVTRTVREITNMVPV